MIKKGSPFSYYGLKVIALEDAEEPSITHLKVGLPNEYFLDVLRVKRTLLQKLPVRYLGNQID